MALSSEVIMTIVLGREKMMQLMIWIRYNRIKQFFTSIIAVRPAKHEIIIAGTDEPSYEYSNTPQAHHAVRACQLLHAPIVNTTVWPGKFLEVDASAPPPICLKILLLPSNLV